jgi:hypothetical protein
MRFYQAFSEWCILHGVFAILWGLSKYLLEARYQVFWERDASVEEVISDTLVIILFSVRWLCERILVIFRDATLLAVFFIVYYEIVTQEWTRLAR